MGFKCWNLIGGRVLFNYKQDSVACKFSFIIIILLSDMTVEREVKLSVSHQSPIPKSLERLLEILDLGISGMKLKRMCNIV